MLTEREAEVVYDLAFNAGWLAKKGCIEIEDSRALFADILHWAREFESGFDSENGDYYEAVDEFTFRHLVEEYRREERQC